MKTINIKLKEHLNRISFEATEERHLSGHMHHRSPYECDDNCGTCDGARCEYCHEYKEYTLRDKSITLEDFINIVLESSHDDQGESIAYLPDHTTLEKWHSQLPILLNGGWDGSEWKDEKKVFSFIFLGEEFQFENFDWSEIPEEYLETVYCLSIGSDEDAEYKHLWFERKMDAEKVEACLGSLAKNGNIFPDLRCNVPNGEIFLSVKGPS